MFPNKTLEHPREGSLKALVLTRKVRTASILCCVVIGIIMRLLKSAKTPLFSSKPKLSNLCSLLSCNFTTFFLLLFLQVSDLHMGMWKAFSFWNILIFENWLLELRQGMGSFNTKDDSLRESSGTVLLHAVFVVTLVWLIEQTSWHFCQLWFLRISKEVITEL